MKFPLRRWPKLLLAAIHTRNPLAHRIVASLPRKHLDRPIFVVGLPRSGTSVFVRHFAGHPDLAHWSEAPAVWDADYRSSEKDHRWTDEDADEKTIRRIDSNFAWYTQWKGKARFVNKHPRNSLRLPFLMAGWPEARIIVVERDPRAVVWSLVSRVRREKWRRRYPLGQFARPPGWHEIDGIPDIVERFARTARAIHRTLHRDLRRCVPLEQRHTVRYEDFTADPRASLRAAWAQCDLEVSNDLLSALPVKLRNMNYKWKREMDRAHIAAMLRILRPMLRELGYPTRASAGEGGRRRRPDG